MLGMFAIKKKKIIGNNGGGLRYIMVNTVAIMKSSSVSRGRRPDGAWWSC